MKATTVQRNLSLYQFTHKRVEAIATELRKAGLLPKAGRGIFAPSVSCEQAAVFALAVAGAERVVDAVQVANELANLVDQDGAKLSMVLSIAICTPHIAAGIRHVRVMTESKMAEVTMQDGTVRRFFDSASWLQEGFVPDAQGQGFVGRIGHIGGAVIDQMALDHSYNDADDEGELAPE